MSKRRGGHGGGHSSSERWLLTYADMITLLLALFIVMYAMSSMDAKKYEQISQSLSSAFHISSGGSDGALDSSNDALPAAGSQPILPGGNPETQALKEMMVDMRERITKENGVEASKGVSMSIDERGLVVSLANSSFFEPGEATLKADAKGPLKTIAGSLAFANRHVMVEGHTDNTPITTSRFPSNWELSTYRATTVVRTLITEHHLSPKRLSAAGYGEYYPVATNATAEGRAKNRRVDIVIVRSDTKGQRPGGTHR
jgi:chemotaxis protein MotB